MSETPRVDVTLVERKCVWELLKTAAKLLWFGRTTLQITGTNWFLNGDPM